MVDINLNNLKLLPYDFSLKGGDTYSELIPIHKSLLVLCSGLFQKNPQLLTDSDIFHVKQFSTHDLHNFVRFLYTNSLPAIRFASQFNIYKAMIDFFGVHLLDYIGAYTTVPADVAQILYEHHVIDDKELGYYIGWTQNPNSKLGKYVGY
jgi:hypothetical protein